MGEKMRKTATIVTKVNTATATARKRSAASSAPPESVAEEREPAKFAQVKLDAVNALLDGLSALSANLTDAQREDLFAMQAELETELEGRRASHGSSLLRASVVEKEGKNLDDDDDITAAERGILFRKRRVPLGEPAVALLSNPRLGVKRSGGSKSPHGSWFRPHTFAGGNSPQGTRRSMRGSGQQQSPRSARGAGGGGVMRQASNKGHLRTQSGNLDVPGCPGAASIGRAGSRVTLADTGNNATHLSPDAAVTLQAPPIVTNTSPPASKATGGSSSRSASSDVSPTRSRALGIEDSRGDDNDDDAGDGYDDDDFEATPSGGVDGDDGVGKPRADAADASDIQRVDSPPVRQLSDEYGDDAFESGGEAGGVKSDGENGTSADESGAGPAARTPSASRDTGGGGGGSASPRQRAANIVVQIPVEPRPSESGRMFPDFGIDAICVEETGEEDDRPLSAQSRKKKSQPIFQLNDGHSPMGGSLEELGFDVWDDEGYEDDYEGIDDYEAMMVAGARELEAEESSDVFASPRSRQAQKHLRIKLAAQQQFCVELRVKDRMHRTWAKAQRAQLDALTVELNKLIDEGSDRRRSSRRRGTERDADRPMSLHRLGQAQEKHGPQVQALTQKINEIQADILSANWEYQETRRWHISQVGLLSDEEAALAREMGEKVIAEFTETKHKTIERRKSFVE